MIRKIKLLSSEKRACEKNLFGGSHLHKSWIYLMFLFFRFSLISSCLYPICLVQKNLLVVIGHFSQLCKKLPFCSGVFAKTMSLGIAACIVNKKLCICNENITRSTTAYIWARWWILDEILSKVFFAIFEITVTMKQKKCFIETVTL